jgi:hypothetical protein
MKGIQAAHRPNRIARQVDRIGQQSSFAFQQIDREKITTARHKMTPIIRHEIFPSNQYEKRRVVSRGKPPFKTVRKPHQTSQRHGFVRWWIAKANPPYIHPPYGRTSL